VQYRNLQPCLYQAQAIVRYKVFFVIDFAKVGSTLSDSNLVCRHKQTKRVLYYFRIRGNTNFLICASCSGETKKDFPECCLFLNLVDIIGKRKTKTFSPLKTDKTTNKAIAPTMIPILNAIYDIYGIVFTVT
jgi:hypothetical protein